MRGPDPAVLAEAAPVPSLPAFLRPVLDPAAIWGLPGQVATTLAATSGADPAAILAAFLTLLGNAAGPQPHAWFGGAQHPARLFTVLVGDAATGRKGTALASVETLFAGADPDWADTRVMSGLQSPEAMIDRVADGGTDCRLMIVEPEFGRLVETMARTGTLSAQLRNAWDGRTLQRTTIHLTQLASRAHISLLGMITPEELLRHHSRLSQAGGLESRILYVCSAPAAEVSPFTAAPDQGLLAGRVQQVLAASRETVMARTDPISRVLLTLRGIQPTSELPVHPDVAAGWPAVKARLPEPSEGYESLLARAEPQVIRLAAAYALADLSGQITMEHVDAALALHAYCARSADIVFSVPLGQLPPRVEPRTAAKIVRLLHDIFPAWLASERIEALLAPLSAAEVVAALRDLTAKRVTEHRQQDTNGHWLREEYRLTPPQLSLFPPA